MSRDKRALIAEVGEAVRRNQNAVDEVDEAVVAHLGINRTDGRCLDVLERIGPSTAGRLAAETRLTTGAVTALLDRLERAGFVRRVRDERDRRRVVVELTPRARRLAAALYGPIAEEGGELLASYTADELRLIRDFLRNETTLLQAHAARIRARPPGPSR